MGDRDGHKLGVPLMYVTEACFQFWSVQSYIEVMIKYLSINVFFLGYITFAVTFSTHRRDIFVKSVILWGYNGSLNE